MLLFESSLSSVFWNVLSYSVIRAYSVCDFEKCTTLFRYFSLLRYLELRSTCGLINFTSLKDTSMYLDTNASNSIKKWLLWVGDKRHLLIGANNTHQNYSSSCFCCLLTFKTSLVLQKIFQNESRQDRWFHLFQFLLCLSHVTGSHD